MTPQQQAQQCLNRNCLVLDTETTGLDDKAEIIEIAVIDATGKVLLNTLVKPSKPIPAEATAIHRITDEMVKDAPTWPEVNPQLCSLISGKTIAIYNAEYDLRLLEQTDRIWKVTPKISVTPQIVCAMHEYAEFYGQKSDRGGYKWQKLTAAAEQQGVIIEGTPHRALSDCLTTLGVIKAMAAGGVRRASIGFEIVDSSVEGGDL
ncbi:3'-5' exonuclease [Serratia nevei]|uniref:3'-5' exonuclease n=1 Tax=Serratia nevei TaxID=2703794 RepID=UPI0011C90576|nr:3'-5' exonuclease [Serratia nevei]TXE72647.1 3'-5' exonuclease [Serratia nevei]